MDPFEIDLTRATVEQLEEARKALLQRLTSPHDDDDVNKLAERAQEVADAIAEHNARVAAADQARAALTRGRVAHTSQPVELGGDGDDNEREPEQRRARSIGETFVRSAEFRAYNGNGKSGQVEVPGAVRALFTTEDYPSQPTRVPGVQIVDRDAPLTILDLIDRQSTTSNVVEWVQEDTHNLAAAEVAEGEVKPESDWAVSLQTSVVQTVAHWVNITRQALSDESQIAGYINGRLTFGLMRRLNGQILNGDGQSPNLRGILNTSGRGQYAADAGESPLVSVRRARTVAELSEYQPDGVVLHPLDWESIELDTDETGRFRVATTVTEGASTRLWGMTAISSTAMGQGRFLVGAFREGATLWEREGVNLYITDSHASNFTSNILTLLAELRAALSVWRPKAFVDGTFAVEAPAGE